MTSISLLLLSLSKKLRLAKQSMYVRQHFLFIYYLFLVCNYFSCLVWCPCLILFIVSNCCMKQCKYFSRDSYIITWLKKCLLKWSVQWGKKIADIHKTTILNCLVISSCLWNLDNIVSSIVFVYMYYFVNRNGIHLCVFLCKDWG